MGWIRSFMESRDTTSFKAVNPGDNMDPGFTGLNPVHSAGSQGNF